MFRRIQKENDQQHNAITDEANTKKKNGSGSFLKDKMDVLLYQIIR